jgi:hypothetical protein
MATPEYHIVGLGLGINHPGTDKERKGTSGNRSSISVQLRDTSTNRTRGTANRRHRRRRRKRSAAPTAARSNRPGTTSRIGNLRGSIVLGVATNDDRFASSSGTRHREAGTAVSTRLGVGEFVDGTIALASRMAFRLALALILADRHCVALVSWKILVAILELL